MSVIMRTRAEILEEMEKIARDLGCDSLQEAIQRQDADDLPKSGMEARLAALRSLIGWYENYAELTAEVCAALPVDEEAEREASRALAERNKNTTTRKLTRRVK